MLRCIMMGKEGDGSEGRGGSVDVGEEKRVQRGWCKEDDDEGKKEEEVKKGNREKKPAKQSGRGPAGDGRQRGMVFLGSS